LAALCDFANGVTPDGFVHPAVRAILLHFWLAYDHPFVDGNGRTARALFYWAMLHSGYWLFEFVSISAILRKAPAQYSRSFLYTETDDNDLTYFLLAQTEVIRKAMRELQNYIARKTSEVREVEQHLRALELFNHRQVALIRHAMQHPGHRYTFISHQKSHAVAYQTARTDLLDLATRGILERWCWSVHQDLSGPIGAHSGPLGLIRPPMRPRIRACAEALAPAAHGERRAR
jgi:Fic family protein